MYPPFTHYINYAVSFAADAVAVTGTEIFSLLLLLLLLSFSAITEVVGVTPCWLFSDDEVVVVGMDNGPVGIVG